ncbi:hypothetical protein DFH06DRAFT_910288, partial [Mycena polygramma]
MVALCRAKCWVVQLRDEDPHMPITQRGVRGHIIVYPQRPSSVATILPPSIEDIITPICVVFVGAQPPTQEWLKKNATPLIVRKERVMNALAWLKRHNHLYKDVKIDNTVFHGHDDTTILPYNIQHIVPSAGIDATTSDYVPGSSLPFDPASAPDLSSILQPPPIAFQSVVVTDVDGNAPSHTLRAAAMEHMKQPGKNFIEIPHDRTPMNEFKDPRLFPMMYPTLYPYGLGGFEDSERRTPLAFKTHVKH